MGSGHLSTRASCGRNIERSPGRETDTPTDTPDRRGPGKNRISQCWKLYTNTPESDSIPAVKPTLKSGIPPSFFGSLPGAPNHSGGDKTRQFGSTASKCTGTTFAQPSTGPA